MSGTVVTSIGLKRSDVHLNRVQSGVEALNRPIEHEGLLVAHVTLAELAQRVEIRRVERLVGRNLDVGRDARPFPVRARDGIDGPAERHAHSHVEAREEIRRDRMGAAAGCLPYDGAALQVLDVIGELLGGRERVTAREDVESCVHHLWPRHVGRRPELLEGIAVADIEAVQVRRAVEKVGHDGLNEGRAAAAVLSQVDNQRIGVAQEVHGRDGGRSRERRVVETVELEVADVAIEDLQFLELEVALPASLEGQLMRDIGVLVALLVLLQELVAHELHAEVPVTADLAHVLRQLPSKLLHGLELVVLALLELAANVLLHLLRYVLEDVGPVESPADRVDRGRLELGARGHRVVLPDNHPPLSKARRRCQKNEQRQEHQKPQTPSERHHPLAEPHVSLLFANTGARQS